MFLIHFYGIIAFYFEAQTLLISLGTLFYLHKFSIDFYHFKSYNKFNIQSFFIRKQFDVKKESSLLRLFLLLFHIICSHPHTELLIWLQTVSIHIICNCLHNYHLLFHFSTSLRQRLPLFDIGKTLVISF